MLKSLGSTLMAPLTKLTTFHANARPSPPFEPGVPFKSRASSATSGPARLKQLGSDLLGPLTRLTGCMSARDKPPMPIQPEPLKIKSAEFRERTERMTEAIATKRQELEALMFRDSTTTSATTTSTTSTTTSNRGGGRAAAAGHRSRAAAARQAAERRAANERDEALRARGLQIEARTDVDLDHGLSVDDLLERALLSPSAADDRDDEEILLGLAGVGDDDEYDDDDDDDYDDYENYDDE